MKKITGNIEPVTSEGFVSPDVVFNNDGLVVDYLKSLLESAPSTSLESGEVHFVHLAMEAAWKLAGVNATFFDAALNFDAERSKIEVDVLRNENKDLRFKSELAKIDVQVLRSENENLKSEITCLKTQLDESKNTLNTLMTENIDLMSRLEFFKNPPEIETISSVDAISPEQAEPEPDIVVTTDNTLASDSEPVVAFDKGTVATEQKEESELPPVAAQDVVACDTSRGSLPKPEIVARNNRLDEKTCSGIAPDIAYISRVLAVNDHVNQKADADEKVIVSRNRVSVDMPIQRTKPASKIVKQQDVRKSQSAQETGRVVKVVPPDPVQLAKTSLEDERKQQTVQQQLVAEPEVKQDDDSVSNKEMLHLDSTDEIDMEPAPAPKVVVRRNVKNYEDLQNEADSTGAVKDGHTVVL